MDGLKKLTENLAKIVLPLSVSLLITTNANARTFKIVNNCFIPIWFGLVGDRNTPVPNNKKYLLYANGDSNVVNIPDTTWHGVIGGRTYCNGMGCETGDCGGGEGNCTHRFTQPTTQVVFSTNSNGMDFYAVEVVNGFNIPISVTPSVGSTANNPYFCGRAGEVRPSQGLSSCSWAFNPPLIEYQWVTAGGATCHANADCALGMLCGLSFNPSNNPLLNKTCGRLLGFWTAKKICSIDRNYGEPFNCSQLLPAPQNNLTWWNLFACVGINSCYSPSAGTDCCGCINWDQIGIPVPPAPITGQCQNQNPIWISGVLPDLSWLKRACPTASTYRYDVTSSTFNCQSMVNNKNQVDYTITFCPTPPLPPPPPPRPPSDKCLPPQNIMYSYPPDKRSVTLTWEKPENSESIYGYEVMDKNRLIWIGNTTSFTDKRLTGNNDTYTYYLYSDCTSGISKIIEIDVVISDMRVL